MTFSEAVVEVPAYRGLALASAVVESTTAAQRDVSRDGRDAGEPAAARLNHRDHGRAVA